jgi:hypothetical protein
MDDIPQDVLYEAYEAAQFGPTEAPAFLYIVGQHFADRAERTRALRKKSWQSTSRELDGVADHIRSYAGQLAAFIVNNPDGVTLVEDDADQRTDAEIDNGITLSPAEQAGRKGKAAKPPLPGNTGRCASFRRADADDPVVCAEIRGHGGDHMSDASHHGPHVWPRTPSGHVCGDVVILHDGPALNCQRPLGHAGDEHYDGRYRLWPRGVGTSRRVTVCERCNRDEHTCPGCGEPVGHFASACPACVAASDAAPVREVETPGTVPPCGDLQPDIATALGTSCMLPKGHTGKHIGYTGARWDQVAPAATLGEQADQMRAAMIPEQRETVENVEREMRAEAAVLAGVPAAVLVAEMKEEVSATVAELTNPFAAPNPSPVSATVMLGNPFQAPAPPPAEFLPPHLVPGAAKAHQSHSSITTMEKCGLQYRLKYRDGIGDDTPAWWNVAGTAFHAVVQAIEAAHATLAIHWAPDGNLMEQERAAHAAWKDEFATLTEQTERSSGKARSTWKAAKGGKEGEAFWREYGGDLARLYVAHRRKFLAEPEGWRLLSKPGGEGWAHEVEFSTEVDGVLLKGFIDAAWISADGATILVEDFKSGSSEGDPLQPKLYGAALRALGFIGDRRVIARFYEARKGAHGATMELTTADDAEVSYRANTAQAMDRAGIFPPSPSNYNCSTCPVKSRCPIMAKKG